ncbi:hypothetical protein BD413DRAFT_559759 [Trametes elegans]|nr:hypothetical protein BD413DRAFT_559759 [Trametes elegans]
MVPQEESRPRLSSNNSRRARVEDDEDEDDLRESNRQRMHSPTPRDDERHHFMPIPDDHGVPQSTVDAGAQPQPRANASPGPQPAPIPPPGRLMWTFEFFPQPPQPAPNAAQEAEGAQDHLPTLNFYFMPVPGAPGPAEAANVPGNAPPTYTFRPYLYSGYTDGGNASAGNPGFAFPSFPFFGPLGMDMVEERDDPERAQRLVDGLEEVPAGLIKRMQHVGGPGTAQGEVPMCAVCWESLLDPDGGGFEGNAELAKAEAAAAREDSASEQERERPMDLDTPTPASHSEPSSSPGASSSTTPSTSSGETESPKIVVLPCSHVFHASCLLPWFSKPGRTTCPSCRFDIDPDSLTYRPRPLRARRAQHPHPPQPGDAPQSQPPSAFGPIPLSSLGTAPAQAAAVPPVGQGAPGDVPPPAPSTGSSDAPRPEAGQNPEGQPRPQHAPLPPFITYDISMIIPVFPGRPAGATQPVPGGQPTGASTDANAQGAAPQPQRTDRNGFRLDDPVLTEAVRNTFERIFGRPAPPPAGAQQSAGEGAAPAGNAPQDVPLEWHAFAGPLPGFPPVPPPNARRASENPARNRKWTVPAAPGPTLRQLVERNEREMGLRCSDVSCGLGPSDEDPITTFDTTALRQIAIRPLKSDGSGKEAVCEHRFHPSCLVSAERVAGWGGEDKKEERENEGEDVEVSCPVCRAVGVISRVDWDEGACTLA